MTVLVGHFIMQFGKHLFCLEMISFERLDLSQTTSHLHPIGAYGAKDSISKVFYILGSDEKCQTHV